jgi:hypothetical protein
MRLIRSAAEQEAAAALVEARLRWLAGRSLPLPASGDIPALYFDDQADRVGLYEDDVLAGCLILDPEPDFARWGSDGLRPGLLLTHLYAAPGRSDGIGRLITLWATDYAARHGLPCVRTEALIWHLPDTDPHARYRAHLCAMSRNDRSRPAPFHDHTDDGERFLCRLCLTGWEIRSTGSDATGERLVARLEAPAQALPRLSALLTCTLPPAPAAHTMSLSGADRD